MPLVFKGTIDAAFVDAQAMPGVAFHVAAHAGAYEAVASTEPTSVSGSADVAQIIQQIAQKAGLQFENNGVSVKVSNPYLPGTAREQILNIARAAGIQWTIENGTVAIWKTGQTRQGSDVEVSPETGMVGYPAFSQSNIVVRTLFNSELRYGGAINLKSDIRPACGRWGIVNISHDLESEMSNGQWFSTIQATTVGGGIAPGGAGV